MLKLAGQYANICYIMASSDTAEEYLTRKQKVIKAAEKAKRRESVAFMSGTMGSRNPRYDSKEYSERIEEAARNGSTYFLTSFPSGQDSLDSMKTFAREVMPSFR